MNTIQKYLSLTAILATGCSPSNQQTEVSTPEPAPVLTQEPDCRSLDLTQKLGFKATFLVVEVGKFCYRIGSKEKHLYDEIFRCDDLNRPLPEYYMVMREFSGPNKDSMQINVVLSVSNETMEYLPFWRDSSGKFSSLPLQSLPQQELEEMFYQGKQMLDQVREVPSVCKKLSEYKP